MHAQLSSEIRSLCFGLNLFVMVPYPLVEGSGVTVRMYKPIRAFDTHIHVIRIKHMPSLRNYIHSLCSAKSNA